MQREERTPRLNSRWAWIVSLPLLLLMAIAAIWFAASVPNVGLRFQSRYDKVSPFVRPYARVFLRPHLAAVSSAAAIVLAGVAFAMKATGRTTGSLLFFYCLWAALHAAWIAAILWLDMAFSFRFEDDPSDLVLSVAVGLAPCLLLLPANGLRLALFALRRSRWTRVMLAASAAVLAWCGWHAASVYLDLVAVRGFLEPGNGLRYKPDQLPWSLAGFRDWPEARLAWGVHELKISDSGELSGDDLFRLRSVHRVHGLEIIGDRFRDADVQHVGHFRGLQYLRLKGNQFTLQSVARFRDLKDLTHLTLEGRGIGPDSPNLPGHLDSLRTLVVSGTSVSDRCLCDMVAGTTRLSSLSVHGSPVTADGLKRTIGMMGGGSTILVVDASQIDEGVSTELGRLGGVRELYIHVKAGERPGFDPRGFPAVRLLELFGPEIHDDWLRLAASTPGLQYLALRRAAVRDSQLPLLESCRNVVWITLNAKSTSAAARQRLQQALPKTSIHPPDE